MILFTLRKNFNFRYQTIKIEKEISNFLKIIFVSTLIYIANLWEFYDLNSIKNVHWDFLVYSDISISLGKSGNENTHGFVNLIFNEYFDYSTPYHYFELWLNSFIFSLSG